MVAKTGTEIWALIGKVLVALSSIATIYVGALAYVDHNEKNARIEVEIFATDFQSPPAVERPDGSESLSYNVTKPQFQGYFEVDVTNSGRNEARDVNLSLPYDGVASFSEGKSVIRTATFKSLVPINIGVLQPTEKITVRLWTSSAPRASSRDDISIRYAAGIGTKVFKQIDYRLSLKILRLSKQATIYLSPILFFVTSYFAFALYRKRKNTKALPDPI